MFMRGDLEARPAPNVSCGSDAKSELPTALVCELSDQVVWSFSLSSDFEQGLCDLASRSETDAIQ